MIGGHLLKRASGQFARILTTIFWIAASLLAVSLFFGGLSYGFMVGLLSAKGVEDVNAVLTGTVAVCSGLLAWYEGRANPADEGEYGDWTGKRTFYTFVFGITVFLSLYFIPVAFFDS